jgi:DNA-binding winged helix-turn-helix (wHTH) protein
LRRSDQPLSARVRLIPEQAGKTMVQLHAPSAQKVLLGPFQLNVKTGELFEAGQKIRLSGQASQLVVILAQRPGQLVTREELRTALWRENTFVDFGHGLNNCISRIREAIGDSAASPRYIQTLPKQGYRFIGEVSVPEEVPGLRSEVVAEVSLPPVAAAIAAIHPPSNVKPLPPTSWRRIAMATMFLLLPGTIAILSLRHPRRGPQVQM